MMLTEKERAKFFSRFDRLGADECWPWKYHAGHAGHGRMWAGGRNTLATHIALQLAGLPRIGAACALHSCDNPSCVNPGHLRWGTQAENIADRIKRGRNGAARGVVNGRSKLTECQVLEIRADMRPSRVIAPEYGISQAMICNIRAKRAWRHVDGLAS